MRVALALTAALMLSGCATFGGGADEYNAEGDWTLESVQRPAAVADRWGDYEIAEAEDGVRYRDELVEILVAAAGGSFVLQISNQSEHSVRVLWESASAVAPNGMAGRVVEGSARIAELNEVSPPITIPAGASSQLTAIPVDNVYRDSRGDVRIAPFSWPAESCAEAAEASLRLVLPLEVQGEASEYTMQFGLSNIEIVGTRGGSMYTAGTVEVSREPC